MNVLFIGNSYTYYNDMPMLLDALVRENGRSVHIDAVTKGGRRLYENLAEGDEYHDRIISLLSERTYDVLILQEQSYYALVDYARFESGVKDLARLVSSARTVLYATWGRKNGCDLLSQYGGTTESMTDLLEDAYRNAAEACGAEVSPVGRCFLAVSERLPALDLYHPDLSHPSYAGSCVAAVVHYRRIFGEMPKSVSALKLDEETIDAICSAVRRVAF